MKPIKISNIKAVQGGMSLVELMIALLIGLLLSAALITVYISNKKVFWDTEAAASLQENNRFVWKLIVNDLRMAGYYGDHVDFQSIENKGVSDLGAGSCLRGTTKSEFDYEVPVWAVEAGETIPTCLAGFDVDPNTDILFVKHVRKESMDASGSSDADRTYILTGLDHGGHYSGTGDTSLADELSIGGEYPGGKIWEYVYHAYFVYKPADAIYSQLKRIKLTSSGWSVPETVAEGVEDLHFIFGINDTASAGAGMVSRYYSASQITAADKWKDVVSATIYIRGRATRSDRSFEDKKTYTYGNRAAYTPSGTDARYHRMLLETTETLYNRQIRKSQK